MTMEREVFPAVITAGENHSQLQVDRTLQIVWKPIAIVFLFVDLKNEDLDHCGNRSMLSFSFCRWTAANNIEGNKWWKHLPAERQQQQTIISFFVSS